MRQASPGARRIGAALCLLLALGSLLACSEPRRPPNIVLIVVDTLRADHLGAYGYERETSPEIDRLARRGIRFERFYSVAPWTTPSILTLFTGLYPQSAFPPAEHREAIRYVIPEAAPTLAERLRAAGYRTIALVDHPGINHRRGHARGFDMLRHLFHAERLKEGSVERPEGTFEGASPAFVLEEFEAALEGGEEPLFLYLHLIYPHQPYTPGPPYGGLFGPRHTSRERAQRQAMIDTYDAEIRKTDDLIGELVAALERRGLLDTTALVLTSDHGEAFWEHGFVEHGKSLFDEELRIPLILLTPSDAGGERVVDVPASNVDLYPTILELAGLEAGEVAGRSLSRYLAAGGPPSDEGEETWFFAESPHSHDIHAVAVLDTAGWKYVHSPGTRRTERLFNFLEDPAERVDLAADGRVETYRELVDRHRRRSRAARSRLGVEEREADAGVVERLEALGYVD